MERAMLEYLANALWQLPVLAGGAWVLLWLMKPGPRTQYRVWLAVLGIAVLLPAWGIRGGRIAAVPVSAPAAVPPAISAATFDQLAMARIIRRAAGVVAVDAPAPLRVDSVPAAGKETGKAIWRLPSRVQRVRLSATVTHWVAGVYVGSVLLGLLRVLKAWRSARGLVEVSREVALCSAAETVLRDFGRSFDVSLPEVRECDAVTSPMVVGAVLPVVLLPEGFAGHSQDEVRAALLHELAHVKRRDYLTNSVCHVVALPVSWHPVAYVVQQRIRRTREMACDEMAAREMKSELGYARCLVTMARRMLSGGLAEQPEFVGLFSNNVLEERVMRLMESKTALSARAKLVRLVSGAAAMATATVMAGSFHVVPTMAAESVVDSSAVRTAVLRATVLSSADAAVGAPACVHRAAKAPVAPVAPASPKAPVAATSPVAARSLVAPVTVAFAKPYAMAATAPVALQAPQSVPAMAPPSPAGAPASPTIAPVAPATPPAAGLAPVTPAAPAAPADKDKNKRKNTYLYQMSPDGDDVVVINGNVRALTPEEKEQVEKAMEQFKNGDFAKHMADVQREMAELKLKDTFDSPQFREEMEVARREFTESAFVNNAELQAKIQTMMKNFDKQKMYIGPCKDGFAKDKDKAKQKQKEPETPQNQ
ncbi:MAG TPA: M56 family metallopeptidase [Edaphobacter sp.]|nr:M56 family metallopeptidase [Edaphobacter sp.]